MPAAVIGVPRPGETSAATYHEQVRTFKRRLLTTALEHSRGNRTYAARALGLQRTYLLRLVRELEVTVPPPGQRRGTS